MSNPNIRLLIADDHLIVRKGIHTLLETEENIEVVGEADTGQSAIQLYHNLKPDVLLLDLILPDISGITVIRKILQQDPDAKIIILTSFAADDQIFSAIQAGALGYLLKDTDPDYLISAIFQVYQGESSLSPLIARKVMQEIFESGSKELIPDPLTKREIEVIQILAKGKSNQEIAQILTISESTVRKHVSNILGKLQLASRTEAALYALKEGFSSLDDID